MSPYSFGVCRICLKNDVNKDFISLFDENGSLAHDFEFVFQISLLRDSVAKNDAIICNSCIQDIQQFSRIKRSVNRNEEVYFKKLRYAKQQNNIISRVNSSSKQALKEFSKFEKAKQSRESSNPQAEQSNSIETSDDSGIDSSETSETSTGSIIENNEPSDKHSNDQSTIDASVSKNNEQNLFLVPMPMIEFIKEEEEEFDLTSDEYLNYLLKVPMPRSIKRVYSDEINK